MNAQEQRLRAELRAESELITPGSLRELDFRQANDLATARPPGPGAGSGRRRSHRAWLAPVAAAASVAVIVATAAVISRHWPSAGRQPGGAGTPTAGQVSGITALSARDAWAVGYLDIGRTRRASDTDVPLIEHWDGARWQRFAAPAGPGNTQLASIAGTSSRDLWAVGTSYGGPPPFRPVIMHWNGRTWRLQRFAAASKAGTLEAVAAASATDAWAVGQTGGREPGALILHWNGNTWSRVPVPAATGDRFLHGVTAISAGDAWAVGTAVDPRSSASGPYILHWNGSAWTQVPGPHLHAPQPALLSVAAGSDGTVLAAGLAGEERSTPLVLRWTGSTWQQVDEGARGLNAGLRAFAILSPSDIWAAGVGQGPQDTVILRWNGTAWNRIPTRGANFRGGINDLAATSASDVWAAGFRGTFYAGVPQILHWNGSKWTRSFGPANTNGLHENSSCGPYATCANPTPSRS